MINKKILSLILFVFVLQSACEDEVIPPPTIQKFGSLSGIVIDSVNGSGYEGAVVISLVNQVTDTTDEAGAFFLDSLMTGTDSILVSSEIHDSLITVLDINEGANEFAFTPKRLSCFNDRPAEDTTRVYFRPISGDTLILDPSLIFVRFDPSIHDTTIIDSLLQKYGLKVSSTGLRRLDGEGWAGVLCPTKGLRAEYFFTPYGKDNFCNFGADPLVEYSFGIIKSNGSIIFGSIDFIFFPGLSESEIFELFNSYGLRFIIKSIRVKGREPVYRTIVTRKAKKNALDLSRQLEDNPLIDFVAASIGAVQPWTPPIVCNL